MSTGFFLPGKSRKPERKRRKVLEKANHKKAQKKPSLRDEEVSSDSDASLGHREDDQRSRELANVEPEDKTAQEKRLHLTKEYLAKLQEKEIELAEDESLAHAAIAHRLREDVLEQAGKLNRKIASQYCEPDPATVKQLKGHRLSVTCLAVTPDDKFVYTGSKDCSIIKWRLDTFSKDYVIPSAHASSNKLHGHTDHVLCLAISSDGKFLASGGRDKLIHIWSVETNYWLHTFKGHRDTVSGLAFRKATHQLFSCSHDRTVKIWNTDEMAYIDTLFGHQDSITGIDSLVRERAITAGGNDRTVRVWKVIEESQLVFHGHRLSLIHI